MTNGVPSASAEAVRGGGGAAGEPAATFPSPVPAAWGLRAKIWTVPWQTMNTLFRGGGVCVGGVIISFNRTLSLEAAKNCECGLKLAAIQKEKELRTRPHKTKSIFITIYCRFQPDLHLSSILAVVDHFGCQTLG
jgi:hypothetical protein